MLIAPPSVRSFHIDQAHQQEVTSMADETQQFATQVQEVSRSISQVIQGMAEIQFNVLQRLAEVQRSQLHQAAEAVRNQLQLIGTIREPGEFTNAQSALVKEFGQKYADSMQEALDIMTRAWQEYAQRLAKTTTSTMG
jgi:phage-related protein